MFLQSIIYNIIEPHRDSNTLSLQTWIWLDYVIYCCMGELFIYIFICQMVIFSHLLWQQDKCQALSTTCKWWVLMRQSSIFTPQRNLLIGWAKYQVNGRGVDSQRTILFTCTVYSSRFHLECVPGCRPNWPNPPAQHFNCGFFIKSSRNRLSVLNPSVNNSLLVKN